MLCFSCHKEEDTLLDAAGVIVKLPQQWKVPISDDGELAEVIVKAPIVYNRSQVLVGGNLSKQRSLISVDALSGQLTWQWQDLLTLARNPGYPDPIYFYAGGYHLYNGKFFFPFADNAYTIALTEGKTYQKYQSSFYRSIIAGGIGNLYFTSGRPSSQLQTSPEALYIGDLSVAKPETPLLVPNYSQVAKMWFNGYGMIRAITPFMAQGDTLLNLLCYDRVLDQEPLQHRTFSALYNLSKRTWVYDRVVLNEGGTQGAWSATLHGQYMYFSSMRELYCFEVMTGKRVWTRFFSESFSSLLIAEGKLYGNNGDRFTYCFDPVTGRQLWKEQSSGSSTSLTYLNGVLYFLGGGDGKLHAIDASTGKHLWRMESPDLKQNSGAWFYGICVAVPGQGGSKGRVVATTGLNAYGYEAIR
ncbi:outer membrane protein assembly factor BamB family protein [Fibrella forsythiae]|uniref:PQQ-binding-like beta-propeller repeat protein n=1 Tax=Fibrella forsythiae TaxID=2817061 RepID=A0ABS3JV76_9BACT|nr:PQQ-binding-like beta-propeller repeat protein [Fibrella forsythiae]MBO0953296.1 PQQ-binding-like beta-propeller repeat protein [Fibrella forsythiae]